MVGTTLGAPLNAFFLTAGVIGLDKSTNGLPNSGVLGITSAASDAGVEGRFDAFSSDPATLFGAGVLGVDESGTQNSEVVGVVGASRGTGMLAYSLSNPVPPGQPQFPALNAACAGGGLAMLASNGFVSPGGDLMSLDCSGNMILKGSVITNHAPLVRTRTSDGEDIATYVPEQAEPSVEDVGEAQLTNGAAYVRIDHRFASAMNPMSRYLVFVTPEGPSLGLYVTDKTPSGFAVRENPGGHSSVGFDYRIVARPIGEAGARLPSEGAIEMGFYRDGLRAPHSTQSVSRWVPFMKSRPEPQSRWVPVRIITTCQNQIL